MFRQSALLRMVIVGLIVGLLAACGTAATPTPAPTPAATPTPAAPGETPTPAETTFEQQWEELIAAAQAEGEVVVVAAGGATRNFGDVFRAFEQEFGISVIVQSGSGSELAGRILSERGQGMYTVDVNMTGPSTTGGQLIPAASVDPLMDYLIHPEVLDTSAWYGGRLWWGDEGQEYLNLFVGNPESGPMINTDMVEPDEIQSYWDLLDPKWQGQMVLTEWRETAGQRSLPWFYTVLGTEWITRLLNEMDVEVVADRNLREEMVALGVKAICIQGCQALELAAGGLPVVELRNMAEGGGLEPGSGSYLGLFNQPANPNAAKLFVNWWLSQEGQHLVQEYGRQHDSLRLDVPKDNVADEYRRDPNVEYGFPLADPELLALADESQAFVLQAMTDAGY